VPSALGTSIWREIGIGGRGILEAVDFLAAELLLPVVGIAVLLFVGWVLPREQTLSDSGLPPLLARAWLAMVRYVAPVAMLVFLVALAFG
jgi:neurotransmitter:Na+ symporter, NSS family